MNVIDKYFFLLLVNSTNKNQKVAVLKSINSSQYKILKDITWKILNQVIPINNTQLRKLSKYKNFIRKLGSSKKVSAQVLGKNYCIVIEIIRIGIQHNEISSKICVSSKRRMGKTKSSFEKSKTIGYCKREDTSTESDSEQFSQSSEEEFSSEEFSSEKENTEKSECSSSGEEFTEECSETDESFEEKTAENKKKEADKEENI